MNDSLFDFFEEENKPKVTQKKWMQETEMSLCLEEDLSSVIDECIEKGICALDLEATGLDIRVFHGKTQTRIVGVCLAVSAYRGWYIPVRHKGYDKNVSWMIVARELRRLCESQTVVIFHNISYDGELLQFNGGEPVGTWDDINDWEDTMVMAYLNNPKEKSVGLKNLSELYLKRPMIQLKDLFGSDHKGSLDYSLLDPEWEPSVWYAVSDALCTFGLYLFFKPAIEQTDSDGKRLITTYKIEKLCLPATRWMKRARIKIDTKKAKELLALGQNEYIECMDAIYTEASKLLDRDITPAYFKILKRDFREDWSIQSQIEIAKQRATIEITDPVGSISKTAHIPRSQVTNFLLKQPGDRLSWLRDILGLNISFNKTISDEVIAVVQTVITHWPSDSCRHEALSLAAEFGISPGEEGRYVVDYPLVYDVKSSAQLGQLLQELGVPNIYRTKSGKVGTSKKAIDSIVESSGNNFPWMTKIKRFRETEKAISSYLIPLIEDSSPVDDTIFVNYVAHRIDTGRFCTPGSRRPEIDGGTRMNVHGTPNKYDPKRPECMNRLRELFVARDGYVMMACDFDGVETRLTANFSREPLWMDVYFTCSNCGQEYYRGDGTETPNPPPHFCLTCGEDKIGDLHTLTAISIFGDLTDRPDWKSYRQKGKSTNFALAYGGGPSAVQRSTGVSKQESYKIKKKYDDTYKVLKSWWDFQHNFARKHGFVRTCFFRKYPTPDINHEDGGFRSKAERNSTNSPIQGSSADITKLAMGLIYKECKERGWLDKVHMLVTLHDELVFEIKEEILSEAYDMIINCMSLNKFIKRMNWPVPLTSGADLGKSWAAPYDLREYLAGKECSKGEWPDYIVNAFSDYKSSHKTAPRIDANGEIFPQDLEEPLAFEEKKQSGEENEEEELEVFVYVIKKALTEELMQEIGQMLIRHNNKGNSIIRLSTVEGELLPWPDGHFKVDEFLWRQEAEEKGF